MVPALIIGISGVCLYGLFLLVRGLFRLVQLHEWKMFYWTLGLFFSVAFWLERASW